MNAGIRGDYVDAEGESFKNVENPGAGRAEYRNDPAFLEQARRLRGMLKTQ